VNERRPAVAGVVLAAGSGTRFGADSNKAYLPLAGRSIFTWSLNTLASIAEIDRLVLVVRLEDYDLATELLDREVPGRAVELVIGGTSRHESEHNALRHLAPAIGSGRLDTVLLHDAARPLVTQTLIRAVIGMAFAHSAAIPALPEDSVVQVNPDGSMTSLNDDAKSKKVMRVQTPQAFAAGAVLESYEKAAREGFEGPDTASCVRQMTSLDVRLILGDPRNIKITYPQDLFVAERILAAADYRLI
jgi:2-C-methyl-D-erythritol 4-phosphate cytidylyltransferase